MRIKITIMGKKARNIFNIDLFLLSENKYYKNTDLVMFIIMTFYIQIILNSMHSLLHQNITKAILYILYIHEMENLHHIRIYETACQSITYKKYCLYNSN